MYNQDFGNSTDLIDISAISGVEFDIKYASEDNFLGRKIYSKPYTLLHKDAAKRLENAAIYARNSGYLLKIFDAFRPHEAQVAMWNFLPDDNYISNPNSGPCSHCRGVALDITLVNIGEKRELDMGTPFDTFSEKSHHDYHNLSQKQRGNRIILAGIMSISGFQSIRTEWWHYQLANLNNYPKYREF